MKKATVYDTHDKAVTADDEFRKFLAESSIDVKADLLEWWQRHEPVYPRVAQAARVYLSIPATTAAAERLFSLVNSIIDRRRSRLSPKTAEMLTVLHTAQ
jgi:hypothetical protein